MNTPPTILVVDDSRVSRMMITAIVREARPDWRIVEAADGEQALAAAASAAPDLAVVDFNMPGMDGLDLAAKLHATLPNLRISLLTANIQEATQKRAAEAGVEFTGKPITEDKIRKILDGLDS